MDLAERGKQIVANAQKKGVHARLLGGLALYLLAPSAQNHPVLQRAYKDIDLVVRRKDGGKLTPILTEAGFEPDRRFNALHGETRLLYTDHDDPGLQVDVFVGVFEQCHKLDLIVGSEHMEYTITPSQLLLTKLQIVQLNEKDVKDLITMFLDWSLGDDDRGLNRNTLAPIFGNNWGLLTTSSDTLDQVSQNAAEYVSDGELNLVLHHIQEFRTLMTTSPKSLKFRMREKIGRKMPWYEIPEEVKR
jgi:hypothetical protein